MMTLREIDGNLTNEFDSDDQDVMADERCTSLGSSSSACEAKRRVVSQLELSGNTFPLQVLDSVSSTCDRERTFLGASCNCRSARKSSPMPKTAH